MEATIRRPPATPSGFRLSVVVAMYNEVDVCPQFFSRLVPVLESIEAQYEIVCVNDGSDDGTLDALRAEHERNPRVRILDLSRNYGKEFALTAGLDSASGDAVVPIDADLQDPPELIPQMLDKWLAGYDVVVAVREDRSSDSGTKRLTASLFYKLMKKVGEVSLPADAGDFRLMDRAVVLALRMMPERTRFLKGMFAWLGFRQTTVRYARAPRAAGRTKWRYWRLWNFALEGIFSFTTLPLRIWTYVGFAVAALGAVYLVFIVTRTLLFGADVPGYPSLLSVILFTSGINLIGLGVLGEYVGRIFVEAKRRPLYLVRERIGFE